MKKIQYTYDEIYNFYNEDYINFTLKNVLQASLMYAKFIPIKDLHIRPSATRRSWKFYDKDPWLLNDYSKDKCKLGRDIVEKGTFWPFVLEQRDGKDLYVLEGNHRIVSLKLLVASGELSEDYKVLCIWENKEKEKEILDPIIVRYLVEMNYGLDIYNDGFIKKHILENIFLNKGAFISKTTIQVTYNE
jgi:hypothetical protein